MRFLTGRLAGLVGLVCLLVASGHALAETCVFETSGNWTSATFYSGTVTGSPCTLSADDSVTIPSGTTATVTTDAVVDDVDVRMTIGSIIVESGGALVVERAGGLGIPDSGLIVMPGGTFQPRGQAISYGDATPSFVPALSDGGGVDVNTSVPVGNVIHCPGTPVGTLAATTSAIVTDCGAGTGSGVQAGTAGIGSQVAICYPDANITAQKLGGFQVAPAGQVGEGFYPEYIASLIKGDILVFWDATNQAPSRDVNAQYEIVDVNQHALNRCIILNVRQGTTETSCLAAADTCHLTDRDIRKCTTAATYVAGQRTITCDAAAIGDANQSVGRNLTCPVDYDANGTAEARARQAVTIVQTTAADVLTLMPGGFPAGVPNASVCWIDYGWKAGDEFSVYRPARLENIQNAACVANDNPVACCDFPGLGSCGTLTCSRGATCDFDFALEHRIARQVWFTGTTVDNSWERESAWAQQVTLVEGPGPINRFQLTSPGYTTEHGFSVSGDGTTTITDSVFRHWGDDLFCANTCTATSAILCDTGPDANTSRVHGITARRVRAEFNGCVGGSCSVFDGCNTVGGPTRYDFTDMLLADAQERNATSTAIYLTNPITPGSTVIRNSVWVGSGASLYESNGSDDRTELHNIYDIGRVLTSVHRTLVSAQVINDASFIGQENTGAGHFLNFDQLRAGGGTISWNRILYLDSDNRSGGPNNWTFMNDPPAAMEINDFALISPNRTGQADFGSMWVISSVAPNTVPLRLKRVTIAMRPGEQNEYSTGINATGDDTTFNNGYRTGEGLLGAYFWNSTSQFALTTDAGDAEFAVSPWCTESNSIDIGASASALLTSAVRDTRQAFVDPAVGNFEPTRGSLFHAAGCGARKSGARDMWALQVLGYDIFSGHGDTWKRPETNGANGLWHAIPH